MTLTTKNTRPFVVAVAAMILATSVLMSKESRPAEASVPGVNGSLVYEGLGQEKRSWHLYTIDADGRNPSRLQGTSSFAPFRPAWSPDGEEIAFDSGSEIHTANPEGYGATTLTPGWVARSDLLHFDPAWSPDGTKLVFVQRHIGSHLHQIMVMSADRSEMYPLTGGAISGMKPAWSPDGSQIAFSCSPFRDGRVRGDSEICLMDADTRTDDVITRTDNLLYDDAPTWSPDGSQIAFSRIEDPSGGNTEVYKMNRDGSDQRNISRHLEDDFQPAWSPDGRFIAFVSTREGGNNDVWTMNADGTGTPTNVTRSPAIRESHPDWQRPTRARVEFEIDKQGLLEGGIRYGETISFSGRLTAGGTALGGRQVIIEQRRNDGTNPTSGTYAPIPGGLVTTDDRGFFRLSGFAPERTMLYRARFGGDGTVSLRPARGPIRIVFVNVTVSLNPITTTPRVGDSVILRGLVDPAFVAGSVKLSIRREGEATTTERRALLTAGRYSLNYTLREPGNYTVHASYGTADYGSTIPRIAFSVRR